MHLSDLPLPLPRGSEPADCDMLLQAARERQGEAAASGSSPNSWQDELMDRRLFPPEMPAWEHLRRLSRGEVVSVTTGQQPALLGGPLLVLLKAATAVELARCLDARGVPAVPVFWNAADDSDFTEAARAAWVRDDLTIEEIALAGEGRPHRQMVGALSVDEVMNEVRRVFDPVPGRALPGPHAEWIAGLWEEAAGGARDMGELFSGWLARVFRQEGLLVVDARRPVLRREGRPLIERYLSTWEEVSRSLEARAATLGGRRALSSRAVSWCLFRLAGDLRLPMEGTEGVEEARHLLSRDPPSVSPNVVLRPLMEDYLFPHVARVVGPTEMLYHDELAPAYSLLGVRRPRRIPRLSLTLLPDEGVELMEASRSSVADLWKDFDGAVSRAASPMERDPAAAALVRLRRGWEEGVRELRGALPEDERELGAQLDRSMRKVDYELGRLEEGMRRQARRALFRRRPRLRQLKEYVFPRGGAQERTISATSLLLNWGPQTAEVLCRLARRHLDRWGEGEWPHLVVRQRIS